MKIYTAVRESGDFIEEVESIKEGLAFIEQYEREDEEEGNYEEDFYELEWEDHTRVKWFYDKSGERVARFDTIEDHNGLYRVNDIWTDKAELEEIEINNDGNEVLTGDTFWKNEREIKKCWKI